MIQKSVINADITSHFYSKQDENEFSIQNLMKTKIQIIPSYRNSHFFLMQIFEKYFTCMPSYVYYDDCYVYYFVSPELDRMIKAKFSSSKVAMCRKFTKHLIFIPYNEPLQLDEFIQNLFQHISVLFMKYDIDFNKEIASIKIFVKESQLKFALGRKGTYIKSLNNLLHSILDQRITLYIRSIEE